MRLEAYVGVESRNNEDFKLNSDSTAVRLQMLEGMIAKFLSWLETSDGLAWHSLNY